MRRKAALPVALVLLAGWPGFQPTVAAKDDKLTAEQLISRHLESIGPTASLEKLHSMTHSGRAILDLVVGGSGHLEGVVQTFSDGNKNSVIIDFGNANYGQERMVFDGDKTDVSFISPGNRSPLGEFLFTYKDLMREGLVGGVLSTAWPLLQISEREPKLKVRGLKKVDEMKAWELEYRMRRGGTDVKIRLYFDDATFRHVKSTYDVTISAGLGSTPEESARLRERRINLTEEFSQFRAVEDLTLPAQWEITYNAEGTGLGTVWKWSALFENAQLNGFVDPQEFQLK